jgi:methyltransferase (TIGR00027 family)
VLTAVARGLYREEPPPLILDDPLAIPLAGKDGLVLLDLMRANLSRDALVAFTRWVAGRGRFVEDLVSEEARNGARQYVILGAGLDSFAYRHPELQEALHVFEVDHPGSQAWKLRSLGELGITAPTNLTFAPVDFETQTLAEGLASAGFDFKARAVVSWIGVTMYLTLDAIRRTVGELAALAPGSRVVLTYNLPLSAVEGVGLETTGPLQAMAAQMGEPFISLFLPEDMERLMLASGFSDISHFGPEEMVREYFPGRTDVRLGGAQRLLVARRR